MDIVKNEDGTYAIDGLVFDRQGKKSSTGKTNIHLMDKAKMDLDGLKLTVTVLAYGRT